MAGQAKRLCQLLYVSMYVVRQLSKINGARRCVDVLVREHIRSGAYMSAPLLRSSLTSTYMPSDKSVSVCIGVHTGYQLEEEARRVLVATSQDVGDDLLF